MEKNPSICVKGTTPVYVPLSSAHLLRLLSQQSSVSAADV